MSSNTKRVHKIKYVFGVTRNNSRLRYAWYSRHGLEMVKDQILIHTHMHSMEINVTRVSMILVSRSSIRQIMSE